MTIVRQRNVHGAPLAVPALGRTVYEDEEVEFDTPLAGFEPVDGEADDDEREDAGLGGFPGKNLFPGEPKHADTEEGSVTPPGGERRPSDARN